MNDERKRPQRHEPSYRSSFSFERFYRVNRRALIWIILAILLWLLRSFFSLIFLTFVFAFIAAPIAGFLARRFKVPRQGAICITFGAFVAVIVALSVFVVPQVAREAMGLVNNLPKTEERILELRQNVLSKYPSIEPILMNYLRSSIPDKMLEGIDLNEVKIEEQAPTLPEVELDSVNRAAENPAVVGPELGDNGQGLTPAERDILRAAKQDEMIIHLFINHQIQQLTQAAPGLIRAMWAALATILLALLFSFLISLDLSRLGQEIRNLRNSKLRYFHEETAQPVVRFAYVVGRTIQAQGMVAIVNTVLTLVGLAILGVPSLTVLSLIVFLCSFIPVLGVFISTTPIVLVAINAGGLNMAMLAVLMVIVVHAVEAYMLNPMIYGKHLKINPVLVLIILFIGHHAFGVWGMLLGVPVAHYFLHDVFGVPIFDEKRGKSPLILADGVDDEAANEEDSGEASRSNDGEPS